MSWRWQDPWGTWSDAQWWRSRWGGELEPDRWAAEVQAGAQTDADASSTAATRWVEDAKRTPLASAEQVQAQGRAESSAVPSTAGTRPEEGDSHTRPGEEKEVARALGSESGLGLEEGVAQKDELLWQWQDGAEWKFCDGDWHSALTDRLYRGELQFELPRRKGQDKYLIDLHRLVQTNGNQKQGGKVRKLRQILQRVILNKDGFQNDMGSASTLHWQMLDDSGWSMMADRTSRDLSQLLLKNASASVKEALLVTLPHDWVQPKSGKAKTTLYTYDLDQMTQRNHDSNKKREIRMVSTQILLEP